MFPTNLARPLIYALADVVQRFEPLSVRLSGRSKKQARGQVFGHP